MSSLFSRTAAPRVSYQTALKIHFHVEMVELVNQRNLKLDAEKCSCDIVLLSEFLKLEEKVIKGNSKDRMWVTFRFNVIFK